MKQKQTENEKKISELLYITKKVNQNIQKNSSIEKKNNIETITPKNKDLKLNTETIKGNILKNENLTNPGILCEILYDENDIPMILNSQIQKTVFYKLEIKNVTNYETPKNCKIIIKDEYEECNILIENPNINSIKSGEKINLNLKLKFNDVKKVKNNENYFEIAVHSEIYGLISKWYKTYIFFKDDSQNIEKYK